MVMAPFMIARKNVMPDSFTKKGRNSMKVSLRPLLSASFLLNSSAILIFLILKYNMTDTASPKGISFQVPSSPHSETAPRMTSGPRVLANSPPSM